ncbi:MAG: Rrf2 family transcriptional regulator [Elusimicrobiota bacterium]|jgi:Rrf2 family protein
MMQVSSKTEYGIRCLLHLAKQGEKAVSISQIAAQEQIPRHFAHQIFLQLRRAGIVKSLRGTQGGFALASEPSKISVGSIVRLLEGVPLQDTCDHFNRRTSCGHLGGCSIRPIWQSISQRLWEALDRINLQHLLTDEKSVGHTLAVELPILTAPIVTIVPPPTL